MWEWLAQMSPLWTRGEMLIFFAAFIFAGFCAGLAVAKGIRW